MRVASSSCIRKEGGKRKLEVTKQMQVPRRRQAWDNTNARGIASILSVVTRRTTPTCYGTD